MNIWWGRRWLKLGYAALREYNRRQRQRERERNRQAGVAGAAPQYPARQQYPTWQREKAEGEYRAWEREQNKQQVRRSVAPTQVETRQQQHEN